MKMPNQRTNAKQLYRGSLPDKKSIQTLRWPLGATAVRWPIGATAVFRVPCSDFNDEFTDEFLV